MQLSHVVYQSVDEIPIQQWEQVAGTNPGLAMDRRLIGAMESTMRLDYPFATIVVSDETGRALAIACTWLFQMDLQEYAWLRSFTRFLPGGWRNRLKIGLLFCGLPLPYGENQLRIAADCDRAAVIAELNRALRELAKQQRASLISVKEFDTRECEKLEGLAQAGFLRCEIPPLHRLDRPFSSLKDYLDALRSRYRAQVNRSLKKFAAAGFRVEQVCGPQRLGDALTDEAHKLYLAVRERSDYKLEILPAELMRELGRRFGPDASLTCAYKENRLAGFTLGLMSGGVYYNLVSGLDYELNAEGDVYFNLFYHDMDFAWKRGAKEIDLGLTSDDFKSRLGTKNEPLYLFIDAKHWLISKGLKVASPWAFPPVKRVEQHDVFKDSSPASSKRPAIEV